jgi:hypothetical protein
MRACVIHRTAKGIVLQGREGEPVSVDRTAMILMQQRGFKKRRVPLEHAFGFPIRRKV